MRRAVITAFVAICAFLSAGYGKAGGETLSEAFRRVSPSVVVVYTVEHTIEPDDAGRVVYERGVGSGVVISPEGLIITAAHLVQMADSVTVRFADGRQVGARVLSSAVQPDVALLKMDEVPKGMAVAATGNSDEAAIGDEVFVVGVPYGMDYTLTVGHISGKREAAGPFEPDLPVVFLQTDAAINEGNSGGPLFSRDGKVVGIVSYILSRSGGSEGLGFAAGIDTATAYLFSRNSSWIGLEYQLVSGALANALNIPGEAGLLVQRVADNSPAAEIGLRSGTVYMRTASRDLIIGGDVILDVQGSPVSSEQSVQHDIQRSISRINLDRDFSLKVLREGKEINLTLPRRSEIPELKEGVKEEPM